MSRDQIVASYIPLKSEDEDKNTIGALVTGLVNSAVTLAGDFHAAAQAAKSAEEQRRAQEFHPFDDIHHDRSLLGIKNCDSPYLDLSRLVEDEREKKAAESVNPENTVKMQIENLVAVLGAMEAEHGDSPSNRAAFDRSLLQLAGEQSGSMRRLLDVLRGDPPLNILDSRIGLGQATMSEYNELYQLASELELLGDKSSMNKKLASQRPSAESSS